MSNEKYIDCYIDRQLLNEGRIVDLLGKLVRDSEQTAQKIDNLTNKLELERQQRVAAVQREIKYNDENLAYIIKLEKRIDELEGKLT